jgi:transcription antitermination factor NusG
MNTEPIKDIVNEPKKWYAVYTWPRTEKKVLERLLEEKIEAYLPLQIKIKQWSDRRKKIEVPLFSSYVFVYINNKEHYTVLNIQSIVRFISCEGKKIPIPDQQILYLKKILENEVEIEETNYTIALGSKVIINAGPLMGMEGELVELTNKKRVVIRLSEIQKSIIINVPLSDLKLVAVENYSSTAV